MTKEEQDEITKEKKENDELNKKLMEVLQFIVRKLQSLDKSDKSDDIFYDRYRKLSNEIADACLTWNNINRLKEMLE